MTKLVANFFNQTFGSWDPQVEVLFRSGFLSAKNGQAYFQKKQYCDDSMSVHQSQLNY